MRREGNIVRYTAEEIDERIANGEARIDHERIAAMTEEELEASIDPEDEGPFDDRIIYTGLPGFGGTMYLKIDDGMAERFRKLGGSHAQHMLDALREYLDRAERTSAAAD